jgi:hypothetical protein
MASTTQKRSTRSGTYCNHCREAFPLRDLDQHFLCATCRTIPGVKGYRDPNKRGLDTGTPAYWEATKHQLNIVTDDAPASTPPVDPAPAEKRIKRETWDEGRGAFVVTYPDPEPPGGTLAQWRHDVFAADLTSDTKLLLLALAESADWSGPTEGGNCFPSLSTLKARLNWTTWRVRKELERATDWVQVSEVARVTPRGTFVRTSNLYQLRWPDGRHLPAGGEKRFSRG